MRYVCRLPVSWTADRGLGVARSSSMRSRQRRRALEGRRRRSFSTEALKQTLYGSTPGEPARQFLLVDHGLVVTLGDHCQVVQVFEQTLVVRDREHDGGAFALRIGLVLPAAYTHVQQPPGSQCSTAWKGLVVLPCHRFSPPGSRLRAGGCHREDDDGQVRFAMAAAAG